MSHWPFIVAAYALTVGGVALLAGWSWLAMRRLERRASELGRRP